MLAAFEFCIAQCIDLFRKNLHANLGFTVFLCWTPAWVGGAAAAHALGTGLLIQAMTKSKSTRKLAKWAAVNNIVGIAAPFVYLSIMLPLGIIGGKRFSRLIGTYNEVNAFLRGLAQSWTPGTPINLLELAPALPLVKKVVLQQERLFVSWRQVFLSYAVTVMFLLIVLVTIALLHLTALRRSIKQTRTAFSSNLPSSRARQQVNRTYTTLLATVIAFVSLATVFFAVSVYAALNPASLQQTVPAQVVVLLPMYAFAVFGFPTSALLVWRAVEASSETGTSQTRRSTSSGSKSGSKPGIDKVDLPRYSIELNANRAETDPTSLDLQLAMIDVSVEIEIEEEVESECDRDLNEKLDYAA
ncbi:uncharacterized protein JCM15063_001150 [Sporobolomyces koalae]|uniref:uncharacterized protein n=1 Tax=Sporobolomyces koalae TaxID=500713 RepID=UPI003177EDE3